MKLSNGLALNSHPSGRHFLQIPGPTNVPDRILRAMDYPTIDHRGPEFQRLGQSVLAGIKAIFQTGSHVVIYPASGTGAWEAALVNTLSPGDTVLMCETGQFATLWRKLAERLGLVVEFIPGDWRRGADAAAIEAALAADGARRIKAVCVVHNETSTGVTSRIPEVRRAIDRTGHPALLMVDSISGLACADYRHDEWGVDVTVSGSQKGLMLPPGLSFNAVSARALAAGKSAKLPRSFWDWNDMIAANKNGYFPYTPALPLLYGLKEALIALEEEGLENVFKRHAYLAGGVRAAVQQGWKLNVCAKKPEWYSDTVSAVVVPEGFDAAKVIDRAFRRYNLLLAGGQDHLKGKVFRIGHLGDLNEIMCLQALAGAEMAMRDLGVPVTAGSGVGAAIEYYRGATTAASLKNAA